MKITIRLVTVLVMTVFLAACGDTDFSAKKTYQIIAKPAPRWIEVIDAASHNSSAIHINENNNSDNQKWFFIRDENGFYRIVSKSLGKCLEVKSNFIQLADIHDGHQQKWILLKDREGYYLIISRTTGQVFDLTGASVSAGTPVGLFMSHADVSQKWSIIEAD
jgi:Ricin-type beta-trefoil lectin domain